MSSAEEWSYAYAKQAGADLAAREVLCHEATVPACQQLHFLQMACEKLVKAHLCKNKSDPRLIQFSHAYVAKNLPTIARLQFNRMMGKASKEPHSVMKRIKHLAREIELLHPAVDEAGKRPDNCEYPWEDSQGNLHIPAEYSYPNLSLLYEPAGRLLLKLVVNAISELV